MDDTSGAAMAQLIDLTQQMDVAYWCRIFDIDAAQLRDAVHHAGHQVQEVQRYLKQHLPHGG
jgi:hypothetical protein